MANPKKSYTIGPGPVPPATAEAVSGLHVVADQSEVIRFLENPQTYSGVSSVKRIDTHGAVVFLAGVDAYKLKRAVRFPFMDLSTLDRRRAACEAEVRVNRANAPELYLGVLPITRRGGRLQLGGTGETVDWVVHMRRFDEEQTFDRIAERGELSTELVSNLVPVVIASHERAPKRDPGSAVRLLSRYLRENEAAFRESPDLFPSDKAAALGKAAKEWLDRVASLLLRRGKQGWVRRCHGDLHLRNVVVIGGEPTLFDAIEFDEAIATGDVLYDLAFLLMDLWQAELEHPANLLFNRYLWATPPDHLEGLAALPLFLSLRAAIRAKVIAAALPHLGDSDRETKTVEARRYFELAQAFLAPASPRLVAIGGFPGSGKSTVAARMAPALGRAPGAVHLRSDIERKRLFGVAETEPLPPAAYTPRASEHVYTTLREKARRALTAGHSVIVDAVHAGPEERRAAAAVASDHSVPFHGIWLDAPIAELERRVERRSGDASDADAEIVRRFSARETGEIEWYRVAACGEPDTVAGAALSFLAG